MRSDSSARLMLIGPARRYEGGFPMQIARYLIFMFALVPSACTGAHAMTEPQSKVQNVQPVATVSAPAAQSSPDFATVAEKVLPSVVSIKVEERARQSRHESPFFGPDGGAPDWFFHFFGDRKGLPTPEMPEREGLGSGFVIDSSGLILTNNHVVDGADVIEVTLGTPDGVHQTVSAKVVGAAPDFDVALLRAEQPINTPALALGNSDQLKVGQWVMAIGNPFGLSQSMSVGIISAKHREDIAPSGHRGIYDFLQTDASINPGNSGGPLVDMNGRVVGMNTAINAQGAGIGFAIPSNVLSRIFPRLRDKGEANRSWIGVQIQSLTPELAQSFGLPDTRGALVAQVVPDSPAEKAGLKEGDVITRFGGKVLSSSSQLPIWASLTPTGKKVDVEVWRKGHSETHAVELAEFPDENAPHARASHKANDFGLSIESLTPELRERLGTDARQGAVITEVEPGSLADRAGLQRGDIITQAQGREVDSAADLAKTLHDKKPGEIIRMQVLRDDAKLFIAIRAR